MTLQERIEAFVQLGFYLKSEPEDLEAIIRQSHHNNQWFTPENTKQSIQAIADSFLNREKLQAWTDSYPIENEPTMKKVALIMAGNIPLVGFQDVLCNFIAGNHSMIKLSDKDKFLLPHLLKIMQLKNTETAEYFSIKDGFLKDFDAVIATGSNNTARYFETYFGKYPNIIRKNRTSVAILTGKETPAQLNALGEDIFQYFGLGCRNVSKIYLPEGYNFEPLMEALHEFKEIQLHDKYKNNFDYNFALFILNRVPHKLTGSLVLLEEPTLQSRIAALHYEFYTDIEAVKHNLLAKQTEIQCVVTDMDVQPFTAIPFGQAQKPTLYDYPDGIDTMSFLLRV